MADTKASEAKTEVKAPAKAEKKEAKAPEAEIPDTPSGLGLKAAEGLEGEEAAEAYQAAKAKARWG